MYVLLDCFVVGIDAVRPPSPRRILTTFPRWFGQLEWHIWLDPVFYPEKMFFYHKRDF